MKNNIKEKINAYAKNRISFFALINFEQDESYFFEAPLTQTQVFFDFRGASNAAPSISKDALDVQFEKNPISLETYQPLFAATQKALHETPLRLINLTLKTPIFCNLSLAEIFCRSAALYKVYLPERFVCFSPERFVQINMDSGEISTNPMKGTIDAAILNARALILSDKKEMEEHETAVQLACDELAAVASEVRVKQYRYISEIKTRHKNLLQVSSEIVWQLEKDFQSQMGDILWKLLPAGSILGVPKNEAKAAITAIEPCLRRFYTGVAIYFDGKILDSCVLIRLIEQEDDALFFRSGGGITQQSQMEKEYEEVLNKIYLPF